MVLLTCVDNSKHMQGYIKKCPTVNTVIAKNVLVAKKCI